MPDSLIDRIKAHLLAAGYAPGDRIETEQELTKRFGSTRSRIREALTALCLHGVLERRPRAGTRVCAFDGAQAAAELAFRFAMAGFDMNDALEARWVIEAAVLPLAIRRMTPTMFARLQAHVDAIEQLGTTDPEAADVHDRDFHLGLLEATGNRTLLAFAGVIHRLFHQTCRRDLGIWSEDRMQQSVRNHRALLAAINAQDVEKAVTLMREHVSPMHFQVPSSGKETAGSRTLSKLTGTSNPKPKSQKRRSQNYE